MNVKQLFICISSGLLLMACSEPTVIEQPLSRVSVYQLPEVERGNQRTFKGIAKAHDLVELSFRVDGRIAEIPVSKGQVVKKGDVLAQLDKSDYQVAVSDRRGKQELTYKQHKRAKTLLTKKLMAQAEYDKIRAEYLVAKAQLKMAELELDYTTLRAPFDGVVGDVFLDSFENVLPGVSVLSTHRSDLIEVNIELADVVLAVTEQDKIAREKRLFTVVFEAYPEVKFTGTPLELNIQKDPITHTYIATLTVPIEPKYKLLEGMPATIHVDLSDLSHTYTGEYLLPVNAVVFPDGGKMSQQQAIVWIYDTEQQTVRSQAIKIGTLVGDEIQVIGGLEGGEVIISNGASRLTEGQKVQREEG